MHQEHPVFRKPDNENVTIWRYMDFPKFVSMIDRKGLFLTRVDILQDKFEGSLSEDYYPPPSPERIAFYDSIFQKDTVNT